MIMITSWNEWLVATAIEPSADLGENFLHAVPEPSTPVVMPMLLIITLLAAVVFCKKRPVSVSESRKKKDCV
jgi:hypothetical protein